MRWKTGGGVVFSKSSALSPAHPPPPIGKERKMNRDDFYKFAAEEGRFCVGDAVYANEDAVPVTGRLEREGPDSFLVFETGPDAVEGSFARRHAQSWVLWVSIDKMKQLLSLAGTQYGGR